MLIGPDRLISEDLPAVIITIIITPPIFIAELRPCGMFVFVLLTSPPSVRETHSSIRGVLCPGESGIVRKERIVMVFRRIH